MTGARDEVLGRIRAALGAGRPAPVDVPRAYRITGTLPPAEVVDLFCERLADYGALVGRTDPAGVAGAIAAALRRRAATRVVAPPGLAADWLVDDVEWTVDDGALTSAFLDGVDGVLTGAAAAIGETGTIVLDGSAGQGRRALTLVPDYHLCVVRSSDVVQTVPEALARLDPTRPLTFVSGPSATSDIELSRVEGVHGPRTLEVVVVENSPSAGTVGRSAAS